MEFDGPCVASELNLLIVKRSIIFVYKIIKYFYLLWSGMTLNYHQMGSIKGLIMVCDDGKLGKILLVISILLYWGLYEDH